MIDTIRKWVSDCLAKSDGNRFMGLLTVGELEVGNFFTGDMAFVSGIPRETKKREDGSEYEEPGSHVLRGGVTVVNGLELIYDGNEGCWKFFSAAHLDLESRKKLYELYKEIDFKTEVEYA
jgi:hypothetical protein